MHHIGLQGMHADSSSPHFNPFLEGFKGRGIARQGIYPFRLGTQHSITHSFIHPHSAYSGSDAWQNLRSSADCGADCALGMIAERVFGFEGHLEESVKDPLKGSVNAQALANALLCCLLLPWTFCLLFYTGECSACQALFLSLRSISMILLPFSTVCCFGALWIPSLLNGRVCTVAPSCNGLGALVSGVLSATLGKQQSLVCALMQEL